jgi:hypothetical protein
VRSEVRGTVLIIFFKKYYENRPPAQVWDQYKNRRWPLTRLQSLSPEKEQKEIKQKELDKLLIEGYQKTRDEDAVLDAEWEEATLESWPE